MPFEEAARPSANPAPTMHATAAEQMTRPASGALGSSVAACTFVSAADFGPITDQVRHKEKQASDVPPDELT